MGQLVGELVVRAFGISTGIAVVIAAALLLF